MRRGGTPNRSSTAAGSYIFTSVTPRVLAMMLTCCARQLQGIAVACHYHRLPPFGLRLAGESAEDVVGFVAGQGEIDEAEGRAELGEVGPLLGQKIGHGLPLGLVLLELLVPEGLLPGIPSNDDRGRSVLA